MQNYMLDLGEGIVVRGSQVTAVIPLWMLTEYELPPELVDKVTCWVELEGGKVVPCFKPQQELLEFIQRVGSPTGGW
jgi:hypothetical protein